MKTEINGVQIELTPEQIKKVLDAQKPVKTKEERFKELIQNLHIKVDFEKYPNCISWFKDGKLYFDYNWKTNYFWCSWSLVWGVFENEYSMKYDDIQSFIKVQVEEHFKLKGVTPGPTHSITTNSVEEHFKLKGVTPENSIGFITSLVEEHFKLKGVTPTFNNIQQKMG